MSQFYGNMKGAKGETTRCGNKNSGLYAHIRGWNIGAKVEMSHDRETGEDICTVILTDGSTDSVSKVLGSFKTRDLL